MAEELFTLELGGLRELHDRLLQLPGDVAENCTETALGDGAEVMANEVVSRAPKNTGEMAANVVVTTSMGTHVDTAFAKIGVSYRGKRAARSRRHGKAPSTEDPGVYAEFVEYGRKGQAAQPFMRPAFDNSAEQALDAFAESMKSQLDKVTG